ncbi:MAG TPA: undecaprenyldiphospho-muramoylpentapeptide beta-N-acetylglucosaminyltransferase [Candidatus Polarisedimenticolia bacterium]|nr:undecaprenyldiphospho-muramoylpentapeptide beta-N-acetylglucosaminyltransferase [Candidatus Polarisedimenticolia bacterium]
MAVETIVVAGGGTGGHLYPGIAIAEELQQRRRGVEVVFAGAGVPLERDILEPYGFRLVAIRSGGVVGKSMVAKIRGALRAVGGFVQSLRLLLGLKPKAVIGVGGYASGPVVMAGVLLRIPTLIHEQNYYPGLTNRILAPWVRQVALSFEESRHYLGGRGEVTGNPIRATFRGARRKTRGETFNVLVFGGSQGSRALNAAVLDALPHLEAHRLGLRFTHGTGVADLARVMSAYAARGFEATVVPYITAIREAYEQADLVIARAGASTVCEIAACGKASILVPLPTAAHDHQSYNARKFAEAGAAILLEEKGLSGESLAREILALRGDPTRVVAMEKAAAALSHLDAGARLADLVEELL